MTEPVLNGEAGCYLLRCPEHLSYAESALVELWACVVASYRLRPRAHPAPQGDWLVVLPHTPAVQYRCTALRTLLESPPPADSGGVVVTCYDKRGHPLRDAFRQVAEYLGKSVIEIACDPDRLSDSEVSETVRCHTNRGGFTDVLLFGEVPAPFLQSALDLLAYGGHLSFTCHCRFAPVAVDVGRLHYNRLMVLATSSWDISDAVAHTRSTALRVGDRLLLFGAGGRWGRCTFIMPLATSRPLRKWWWSIVIPSGWSFCVRRASRLPKRVGSNCSFIAMPKPASTSKNLR